MQTNFLSSYPFSIECKLDLNKNMVKCMGMDIHTHMVSQNIYFPFLSGIFYLYFLTVQMAIFCHSVTPLFKVIFHKRIYLS